MAYIDWSDKYRTGNHEIDSDHQSLFMFVNALHDTVSGGSPDIDSMTDLFNGLIRYIELHFDREESLLRKVDYPDLANHCESHTALAERVRAYKAEFDSDPYVLDHGEVLEFLKDWLHNHILKTDMAYVPYIETN